MDFHSRLLLFLIHCGSEIPLAGVRKQHHDGLACVFFLLGQLQRCMEGCTGGNACQNAFLGTHTAAGGISLLRSDSDYFIQKAGIQDFRHKVGAYALDAVGTCHTGMVSGATGFLDFLSYAAASATSTLFAEAVTTIGWGNLILVWAGLMFVGIIVALPYRSFLKKAESES